MPSAMSLLADRYRLDSRIAVGGEGEVWRGTDVVLERLVAIKLLREEYQQHAETLARFRAEARHAGSLSHPGIAQIYDYREADPPHPPYLVMELVRGPSLAEVLASAPLGAAFAMDVVAQTAAALQVAHAAGLVHRDIKPGNLLLGPDGHVKITDFGIAYAAGSAPVTRTGTLIGTPSYVAPERVAGAPATPAADLYALGVVAYECLAGAPPFRGDSLEVVFAHRDRPLPPLPSAVPVDVAALVAELTAKDPAARPADAGVVAARARRLSHAAAAATGAGVTTLTATAAATPPPTLAGSVHPRPPRLRGCLAGLNRRLREGAGRLREACRRPGAATLRAGGRLGRNGRAALAIAGITVVGLGLLFASVLGSAPAGRAKAVPRPVTHSPTVDRMVEINGAALAGRPVGQVTDQLEQLGLAVQVRWRPGGRHVAGTVVSAQPTGQVPVGSVVVLVGAAAPAGHPVPPAHGHGHGKKAGHGNGG